MDDIRIFFNRIYQNNKFIIGVIVISIILVVLVLLNIQKNTFRDSDNTISDGVSESTKVKELVNNNKVNTYEELRKEISSFEGRVEAFILFCNQNNTDLAYEMISNKCKQELYPTKQDFTNSYYNVIFKTNKYYDIANIGKNTYKIKYKESAITTGVETDESIIEYITINDDGKLNISNFVDSKDMDITAIDNYFSIKILKETTYVDYKKYTVQVKNTTMADIYIDDIENSNLYLRSNTQNRYFVNNSDCLDYSYLIPAKGEKTLDLKFNVNDLSNDKTFKIDEICFNSIKINNKSYVDSTSGYMDQSTGEIKYVEKRTNYPESYKYSIKLQ